MCPRYGHGPLTANQQTFKGGQHGRTLHVVRWSRRNSSVKVSGFSSSACPDTTPDTYQRSGHHYSNDGPNYHQNARYNYDTICPVLKPGFFGAQFGETEANHRQRDGDKYSGCNVNSLHRRFPKDLGSGYHMSDSHRGNRDCVSTAPRKSPRRRLQAPSRGRGPRSSTRRTGRPGTGPIRRCVPCRSPTPLIAGRLDGL